MSRKIEVVPYDSEWITLFEKEKILLENLLNPENLVNIFHIGSTSIIDLIAKPTIDILLVVKSLEKLDTDNSKIASLDYIAKGEFGIKNRRFFTKGGDNRTHHIHAFQYDNLYEIERHLAVRNYLRQHPSVAKEYAAIKLQGAQRFSHNSQEYSLFKDNFIKQLEKKAIIWYLAQKN